MHGVSEIADRKEKTSVKSASGITVPEAFSHVFLINSLLHLGQVIWIFPLPLGTRTV